MPNEQCVVFQTPGLIPIESFTTFGVNAKPMSTSPLGYFGTGLKYAIAVLLRNGCKVVLWRGGDKYTFYGIDTDFRGTQFGMVRMKHERWTLSGALLGRPRYTALPFTTELGKNWELWQAFRELETNTRDEGGKTYLGHTVAAGPPMKDTTVIRVYGARFVDEFLDMDRNFLKDGKVVREDEAIQVIDRPSKHIYYRSMRIMDLKEEAEFTYNFLKVVDLTEDRTAKYPWMLESFIADHIAAHDDPEFVGRAVGTRRWESGLNYGYTPSAGRAFLTVSANSPNPTARALREKVEKALEVPTSVTLYITIPKSEVTEKELDDVRIALSAIFKVSGGEGIKVVNRNTDEEVAF